MDVFSRTFLPATAEAALSIPMVSRHLPVLRRCVTPHEPTVLVARCHRPDRPLGGSYLLLLTTARMVVTRETRVLRRIQLHLTADLRELSHVTWIPDARLRAVELAATAIDGIRERFWIPLSGPQRVSQVDALFSHVFRSRSVVPDVVWTTPRASRVPLRSLATSH